MARKQTIKILLQHKNRIYGGKHEVAWGDSEDWRKGTISTSSHTKWSIAKKKAEALKDKFKVQGFSVILNMRK